MTRDATDRLALLYDLARWTSGIAAIRGYRLLEEATEDARDVAIMGAGSGRIALPLASASRRTFAVDLDLAQLRRIPSTRGLNPVRADIRPHHFLFSASRLVQVTDLKAATYFALSALSPSEVVWIDMSKSSRTRAAHDWCCVLVCEAECPELALPVQEWQRCRDF